MADRQADSIPHYQVGPLDTPDSRELRLRSGCEDKFYLSICSAPVDTKTDNHNQQKVWSAARRTGPPPSQCSAATAQFSRSGPASITTTPLLLLIFLAPVNSVCVWDVAAPPAAGLRGWRAVTLAGPAGEPGNDARTSSTPLHSLFNFLAVRV